MFMMKIPNKIELFLFLQFFKYIFDIINFVLRIYEDCGILFFFFSFFCWIFHFNCSAVSCHCTMCVQPFRLHIHLYCFIVYVFLDSFSPKQNFLNFFFLCSGSCVCWDWVSEANILFFFSIFSHTLSFKAQTDITRYYGDWR